MIMIGNVLYIHTITNKIKIYFHLDISLLLTTLTRILIDILELIFTLLQFILYTDNIMLFKNHELVHAWSLFKTLLVFPLFVDKDLYC